MSCYNELIVAVLLWSSSFCLCKSPASLAALFLNIRLALAPFLLSSRLPLSRWVISEIVGISVTLVSWRY